MNKSMHKHLLQVCNARICRVQQSHRTLIHYKLQAYLDNNSSPIFQTLQISAKGMNIYDFTQHVTSPQNLGDILGTNLELCFIVNRGKLLTKCDNVTIRNY